MVVWGQHGDGVETIKLPKSITPQDFEGRFDPWKRRWDECTATGGVYFEEDKIDVRKTMKG